MGQEPPEGQEFLDAVYVTKAQDGNAVGAAVMGGAIGAGLYANSESGKRQATLKQAHKELGLSNGMIWAFNPRHFYIFKANTLTTKPKAMSGRLPLQDIGLLGVGRNVKFGMQITMYGVLVPVNVKKSDGERFAAALEVALAGARPGGE